MKHFALALFALALTAGCKAQIATVPQVSCPAVGSYVALNSTSPSTGTTYTDSGMASGTSYCYVAQFLPTGVASGGTSAPSNVAGPFTVPNTNVTHEVALSWTAPQAGGAYVISRIPAISTVPSSPTNLTAPTIAQVKPALPDPLGLNLKLVASR